MARVAVEGDAVAVVDPAGTLAGASGSFTPGPVTVSTHDHLTVGGARVIHEARCTFSFTDASTSATTPVTLTLSATATLLTAGGVPVLVAGDATPADPQVVGARIEVRAAGVLTTAPG